MCGHVCAVWVYVRILEAVLQPSQRERPLDTAPIPNLPTSFIPSLCGPSLSNPKSLSPDAE